MSFQLLDESEVVREGNTFIIKLYFDYDTNMQKHEYVLNDEVFYFLEYEAWPFDEPEKDLRIGSIVAGFIDWYDQFGMEWIQRKEVF